MAYQMSGSEIGKVKAAKQLALKKTGTFKGKSNKLGGGGRFKQLEAQGKSPALAAYIGRQSLGVKRFNQLALQGKKRALRRQSVEE